MNYSALIENRKSVRAFSEKEVPLSVAADIIAFHDSDKSFRNMSYALPRVLERIKELGLKCKIIEL